MYIFRLLFLIFLLSGAVQYGHAQEKENDRAAESKKDKEEDATILLHNDLTKPFYRWIFRSSYKRSHEEEITHSQFDYTLFEEKKIRDIEIDTRKPLGYSLRDPSRRPDHWIEKLGNAIHTRSKRSAVDKFLLFEEGMPPDSFLIEESARLIREQNYIRDILVRIDSSASQPSVSKITVQSLDSWSIIPHIGLSRRHMRIGLLERNFLGMGHRAELMYVRDSSRIQNGLEASYMIPNIKGTFVDAIAKYDVNFDKNFDRFLYLKRDFFSPLTKWAGGILVEDHSLERKQILEEETDRIFDLRYQYFKAWGGWAFHPFNKATDIGKSTSLVVALKTSFLNYKETPSAIIDPDRFFADQSLYLLSVGISSRRYFHDSYIFRDGETEDVPAGILYSMTTGLQRKNQKSRFYMGIRGAYGTYFKAGYAGMDIEAGSFLTKNNMEETALSIKVNYFSNLFHLGEKWKFRQFVKPQIVLGFNRSDSPYDRLGLNEHPFFRGVNNSTYLDYENKKRYTDYGSGNIKGFTGSALGTSKYVLNLQTQLYSPMEIAGFLINPFFGVNLAYLQNKKEQTQGSNGTYASFSLGFILRNRFFVFKLFQVSFTYYPEMPGEGYNLFRFNQNKTESFGFPDFQFDEPRRVIYE